MRLDSELMSLVSTPSFARAFSIADCFSLMLAWMACSEAERDASGSSAASASIAEHQRQRQARPPAVACEASVVRARPLPEAEAFWIHHVSFQRLRG